MLYKTGNENMIKHKKNFNPLVVLEHKLDDTDALKKQRETYIAILNHDLKIPTLAQIRALELLSSENLGTLNSRQQELLDLTLDSCRYMYGMLTDLLLIYKYENNDVVLTFEKVELLRFLEDSFKDFETIMKAKNLKFVVRAKDKCYGIKADKAHLKKAFNNVLNTCISNAFDGTEIVIDLSKSHDKGRINLSINSKSPYMPPETIKGLFSRYVTCSEKMDKVGSGVLLYLAKRIINLHRGDIHINSFKDNYNFYSIIFPCINECKFCACAQKV